MVKRNVSVKLKRVKNTLYCYINYKGLSTRFRYHKQNKFNSNDEINKIILVVNYVEDIKEVESLIQLRQPIKELTGYVSNYLVSSVIYKLGFKMNFHQFKYLLVTSGNPEDRFLLSSVSGFKSSDYQSISKLDNPEYLEYLEKQVDQLSARDDGWFDEGLKNFNKGLDRSIGFLTGRVKTVESKKLSIPPHLLGLLDEEDKVQFCSEVLLYEFERTNNVQIIDWKLDDTINQMFSDFCSTNRNYRGLPISISMEDVDSDQIIKSISQCITRIPNMQARK